MARVGPPQQWRAGPPAPDTQSQGGGSAGAPSARPFRRKARPLGGRGPLFFCLIHSPVAPGGPGESSLACPERGPGRDPPRAAARTGRAAPCAPRGRGGRGPLVGGRGHGGLSWGALCAAKRARVTGACVSGFGSRPAGWVLGHVPRAAVRVAGGEKAQRKELKWASSAVARRESTTLLSSTGPPPPCVCLSPPRPHTSGLATSSSSKHTHTPSNNNKPAAAHEGGAPPPRPKEGR
jgi:hypothetical protein